MPKKTHDEWVPFAAIVRGDSRGIGLLLFGQRNQARFAALFEPVTLTTNVHCGGMVQQTVEDGRCDDRVAEDRTPFAVALFEVSMMLPLS